MTQATPTSDAGRTQAGRRVLVIDDEQPLARLVRSYLERDGFEVAMAFDGAGAVEAARSFDPDVVILDLGLPGIDGVEVCRQVRTFSDCYVVMLTARSEESDKLIGLSAGADDYVTTPFSPRELVARVHVMLRRPRRVSQTPGDSHQQPLTLGGLSIDLEGREVLLNGKRIDLTPTEFDLLATLAGRPRLAYSRRQLIDIVWGDGWVSDEHLIDVHIGHLRRKLGDEAASPRFIRTVRGIGYRMGDLR